MGDSVSAVNARTVWKSRQGEGKLAEQRAGNPPIRAIGAYTAASVMVHGDNRQGYLPGANDGGTEWLLSRLDVTIHVFYYYGVVHHQTYGQNHG